MEVKKSNSFERFSRIWLSTRAAMGRLKNRIKLHQVRLNAPWLLVRGETGAPRNNPRSRVAHFLYVLIYAPFFHKNAGIITKRIEVTGYKNYSPYPKQVKSHFCK